MRSSMIVLMALLAGCGANTGDGTSWPDRSPNNISEQEYDNNDYAGDEALNAEWSGNNTTGALPPGTNGENYEAWVENDFVATADETTSTFSIDVDTASYTLMRRDLQGGRLPDPDGVRVEEYLNFFAYDYPQPAASDPFSINLEVAPSEFGSDLHMLRVGLHGRAVALEDLRPVNLVFLVDSSGSMSDEMPLVKHALRTLTNSLRPGDRIGIVTYAGNAGVRLASTDLTEKTEILDAIAGLTAGGGTYGEGGIVRAYEVAEASRLEDGINRVVLMTDGDFNIGLTGQALRDLVEAKRDLHIGLTVAGVGVGNYNDADLEAFARNANGNYFYVDSEAEADRVFGTEVASTLEVIAADVKVQVAFDAEAVLRYRLVGYENRVLENQDFDDDSKDAGEIGPGHTVTALYELELAPDATPQSGFIAEVRLRHKAQFGEESELQTQSIKPSQVKASVADASDDLRFAMAVTEFAEILRNSKHTEGLRIDDVDALAAGAATGQADRAEFLELIDLARPLLTAP